MHKVSKRSFNPLLESFQNVFLCYFKNIDSFLMCLMVFVLAVFLRNDRNWAFLVLPYEVTLTSAHQAEIITPQDALIPKLGT